MTDLETFALNLAKSTAERYAPGAAALVESYVTAENADKILKMVDAVIHAIYQYVPGSAQSLLDMIDAEILKIDGIVAPAPAPDA